MTSVLTRPGVVDQPLDAPTRRAADVRTLTFASFASIGAGAIHAAAIGAHGEHRQAAIAFTFAAAFQVGWGVLALLHAGRLIAVVGAIGNVGLVAGWVLAKTSGISFVDGLEAKEGIQRSDGLAVLLAGVAVVAALATLARRRGRVGTPRGAAMFGLLVVGLTVPGLLGVSSHSHATGDHHGEAAAHVDAAGADHHAADPAGSVPAVVAPVPYDPTKPIDLGGVDGVTPEQQARAENLIAVTLLRLPQFADPSTVEALGFYSIGDAPTGFEHYVNWKYINDDKILDPDFPESLVYKIEGTGKRLVSAMFMLPEGTTLADVPDVGGPLTQWHIHDDLCFSDDPIAPKVLGLTAVGGTCSPPLVKFVPVPMIHVWITPHECGPFAALEGVGAGQINEGEARLCDHAHGG